MPEPSAPPVNVTYVDAALKIAGNLIPLTLFRRPVQQNVATQTRWEVEKNLSRLAAEWRDRVATCINELTHQAEEQALDELGSLEQLAAQLSPKGTVLQMAIQELKQFQDRMHNEQTEACSCVE